MSSATDSFDESTMPVQIHSLVRQFHLDLESMFGTYSRVAVCFVLNPSVEDLERYQDTTYIHFPSSGGCQAYYFCLQGDFSEFFVERFSDHTLCALVVKFEKDQRIDFEMMVRLFLQSRYRYILKGIKECL
jgi:hypothetical protein